MYKYKFLSAVLLVLLLTACNARTLTGSGTLISETRQVSQFDSIVLTGSGKVIVTQDGSEALRVETDDNLMAHVKTVVDNGTLILGYENDTFNWMMFPSQLVFYVSVDDLAGLTVTGSGDMEADPIETDRLDVSISGSGNIRLADLSADEIITDISGSGDVTLAGHAGLQEITIVGSGKYLTGDLCSASVEVNIIGSGDATVCATETLNSNIIGSGSVNYYGQPSVHSSGSGSGKLNSLGDQ